jgi:curli biogenesis system outer membrane secretion channel CsgG
MIGRALVLGVAVGFTALGPVVGAATAEAQEKPRVAVIPFDNPTSWWGRQLGSSAADQLAVKLVNSGAFTVLERQRVDAVFDEWSLKEAGVVTPEKAAEVGRLLGVEYLITGRFVSFDIQHRKVGGRVPGTRIGVGGTQTRAESSLNARVVNVSTGEVVAAMEASSDEIIGQSSRAGSYTYANVSQRSAWNPTIAERALGPAIERMVNDLVGRRHLFRSAAQVAVTQLSSEPPAIVGLAADGSVYINQGQNVGMTPARRFHVLRVVDEIKDGSGTVLDRITERVGVIEVTRVLSQSSICKVIEGRPDPSDLLEPASQ